MQLAGPQRDVPNVHRKKLSGVHKADVIQLDKQERVCLSWPEYFPTMQMREVMLEVGASPYLAGQGYPEGLCAEDRLACQRKQGGIDSNAELHGQLRRDDRGQNHGAVEEQLEAVPVRVLQQKRGGVVRCERPACSPEKDRACTAGQTSPPWPTLNAWHKCGKPVGCMFSSTWCSLQGFCLSSRGH